MANGKVAGYPLELRVAIADALINGRDYADIRDYLREAGLEAADLPSDHSIRTYQESVEYSTMYKHRVEAVSLRNLAGSKTGMAAARVEIIQESALHSLERWLDAGLLEPADIFKALAFTLQFQRQSLAGRKLPQQLGDQELPEPLGPLPIAKSVLDAFLAHEAQDAMAATAPDATTAQQPTAAVAMDDTGTTPRTQTAPATAASDDRDADASARILEEDGGYSRIVEEDEGFSSISEDSGTADATPDDEEPVAVYEDVLAATGTDGPASGWSSSPTFRNSPSAAARAKARHKRKKRRR